MCTKPIARAKPASTMPLLVCSFALLASCTSPMPVTAVSETGSQHVSQRRSSLDAQDLVERDARSVIEIRYPPNVERAPALAKLLEEHALARRAALAAALRQSPRSTARHHLTLRFRTLADAPRMYVIATDEEWSINNRRKRTEPEVFLWLPSENRLLSPDEMIPNPASWARLHDYVIRRAQEESASLATAQSTRAMRRSFVPRFNSSGDIAGLRFQTEDGGEVEVPGVLIKPLAAPAYAGWFDDASSGPLANSTASL